MIYASIIIVIYNANNERKDAVLKFLKEIYKQTLPFEIICVNSSNIKFDGLQNFIEVKVDELNVNKVLWQKEAFINIGVKHCNTDNIIVMDSDVYSEDTGWVERVVDNINNYNITQCFDVCYEMNGESRTPIFQSRGSYNNGEYDLPVNDGLCIGMSRHILESNNYFNPYFIYGGGDSLFIKEYTDTDISWVDNYPKLHNVVRKGMIKYNLEYLKESVLHIRHRSYNKDYQKRHEILKHFEFEIMDMVTVSNNGLQWNNPYPEIELVKSVM